MKYRRIIFLILSFSILLSVFMVNEGSAAGAGDGNGILAYGVDVSSWQGKVDWQKVKNDGKSFAILRIGTSKGKDTYFEENYKNAKAAGMNVGCYFYTYATTEEEVLLDAENVLSWLEGKQLEYPVYYDMENSAQLADNITIQMRTKMCLAFLDEMKENGWYAGTYANANWFNNYLDKGSLGENYELWLASWMNSGLPSRDYSTEYGLWQYTDSGSVNGINTAVDLDVAYRDYPTIMKNGGFNGYKAISQAVDEEWIITSSNGVNVRSGAGTSFEKTGFLGYGERIYVTEKMTGNNYTWGKIGENRWCVLAFAEETTSQLKVAQNSNCTIDEERKFINVPQLSLHINDLLEVNGYASIKITENEYAAGTGTVVELMLGETVVSTYYVVIDGDINGDSVVDAFDVTISLAVTNFTAEFESSSPQFHSADVNKDGVCDVYDSEIISAMSVLDDTLLTEK